ncbi:hypothetical protein SDC9_166820 [bioreactor metagenome]|uniref:Uncharacterized protein n=1 Tax=bioreactor metagenome TaxID=1076179 RepID=A0A645FY17_9ZZZZ
MVDDALLHAGFAHQSYAALGQVTQTAMEQAAGAAARSISHIMLLDEGDFHSAHGGVAGH